MIQQPFPVQVLFDGDADPVVVGTDSTTSRIGRGVRALQVDTMTGATDARVQVRLDDSSAWVDHLALTEANTNQMVLFDVPVNQVRVIGLVAGSRVVAQL